jgi:hypothetical protein
MEWRRYCDVSNFHFFFFKKVMSMFRKIMITENVIFLIFALYKVKKPHEVSKYFS